MPGPDDDLTPSGLLAEAISDYDEVLGELSQLLSARAADQAVALIDRFQAATIQLLRALRLQLRDDCQNVVMQSSVVVDRRFKKVEADVANLKALMGVDR